MTEDDLEPQLPQLRERFLRRLRRRLPPDVAEDLVQDTLLALWRAHATIQGNGAARYGHGILRNTLRHHWRGLARRPGFSPLDDQGGELPEVAVEATQENEILVGLLDELLAAFPADRRSLFVDVVVRGVALQDAADTRGIAIGTARSRVSRMTEAVRAALDGGRRPHFRPAA